MSLLLARLGGGTGWTLSLSDTATTNDAQAKDVATSPTDTGTSSDAAAKDIATAPADTATNSDARAADFGSARDDAATVADATAKDAASTQADLASAGDARATDVATAADDTSTTDDATTKDVATSASDAATASDERGADIATTASDSATLDDALAKDVATAADDTSTTDDATSASSGFERIFDEAVAAIDGASTSLHHIATTGVIIPARVVPYTVPAAVVPYTVAAAVVPYQIPAAVVPYTIAARVVPYVIPGGTMSNGQIPRGPALEFARGGSKPCIFPLTAGGTTPYTPTGTLVLRIGRNAADALYEVELDAITSPNWSCTAAPDIASGSYAYWVVDVVADAPDAFLCTGAATVIDAVGPAAG